MMGDALKLHSTLGHRFPWLHFPLRPGFRQPNETLQICKLQIIYLQSYDLLLSYPSRLWYFHKTSPISKSATPPAPLNKNKAGVSIVVHKKLLRSTIMISQQRSFSSYCLYIIQVSHAHMVLPENAPKGRVFIGQSCIHAKFVKYNSPRRPWASVIVRVIIYNLLNLNNCISKSSKKVFLKISYISYTNTRKHQ